MGNEAGFVRIIGALLALAAVVVGVFFFTSIGSFALDDVSETRTFNELAPFSKIVLKGSGTLVLKESQVPTASITSDTALLGKFEVTSESGTLTISMSELDTVRALKLDPEITTITISAPELESVKLNGSYLIDETSRITGDEVTLDSNGKISGKLHLTSNTSRLEFGGQHTLEVSGAAFAELSMVGNGSGKIDAHTLASPKTDITLNGSLTVRVGSPRAATLELNGASKVFFESLPTEQFAVRTAGQSVVGIYDPSQNKSASPTSTDD